MTLIDEREEYLEQERKRKLFKKIITAIIVLVILALILLIFMKIKNYGKLTIVVDGKEVSSYSKTLVLKDDAGNIYKDNGQIYLSVRDVSNMLGRQYYNSEYKSKGEDKSKCQIKNGDEYTSLVADSKKVYKAVKITIGESQNSNDDSFQEIPENVVNFEYFDVNNTVKYIDDTLYADIDAIELAFDIDISYDSKNNKITISTLDYLENMAKSRRNDVSDSSEYAYTNRRLLKYGLCVVNNSDGIYGVASYTNGEKLGECIVSCKYKSIEFNEAAGALKAIGTDGKNSIIKLDLANQAIAQTIASNYDDIQIMDNECNYFKVKSSNMYGVIDSDNNLVLPNAYEDIGINDALYTDIYNKYILRGKYIPVKQEGLWGLCDTQGNILITPRFQGVGCTLAQNGNSVIIVPEAKDDADGIVFLYNREKSLYGLYNANNGEKIAVSLIEVYKKVESGIDNYYMNHVIDVNNPKIHTINVYEDL